MTSVHLTEVTNESGNALLKLSTNHTPYYDPTLYHHPASKLNGEV